MARRYESPPALTAADARQLLESGDAGWDDLPPVILGVAFHERDRDIAEEFCGRYVGAMHDECSRAGLLGLAHLARRFESCAPRTWALVEAAKGDEALSPYWSDVDDDFRKFVDPLPVWERPVCELRGSRIDSLDDFWDEVSASLIPGAQWGRNLDAFNDILRGGFGTPEGGFTLRWLDFDHCEQALGHSAMVDHLRNVLTRCHSSNRSRVQAELAQATRSR